MKSMDKMEKEWQAEDDARSLIRAAELKEEPDRQKAAVAKLEEQIADAQKAIQMKQDVINKASTQSQPKNTSKKQGNDPMTMKKSKDSWPMSRGF